MKFDELLDENPLLKKEVDAGTPIKELLLYYVGTKKKPDNDEITVEMMVEVLSEEFPDFVMVLAEENFLRGYEQAVADLFPAPLQKEENEPVEPS